MTRSALRMAIQQAGSRACAASSMNKVLNLRPVNIRLAELTSVGHFAWNKSCDGSGEKRNY